MALAPLAVGCAAGSEPPLDAVAEELLAADRRFSEAAAATDLISGLTAMFADDVVMVAPPGRLATGAGEVRAALEGNPANAGSRVRWTPVRAGVSADGAHGFTYGYMTIVRAGGDSVPAKYVAYWIRGVDGWKVAAYKRTGSPAFAPSPVLRPPVVPAGRVAAATDSVVARYEGELRAAERSFSDTAQSGFADAFRRFAADDAAHSGGPADTTFRFGPDAIAQGIGGGGEPFPGQVTWESSIVRVARSGDLGVSIGFIAFRASPSDTAPTRTPFLTIWRRPDSRSPWRYVIE
jgi:ketosteroid isomerase-like protein